MTTRGLWLAIAAWLLLAAGAGAVEFSADSVMVMNGTHKGKVYVKGPETNRTEMMGMVHIMRYPLVYQLVVNTKKYAVMNIKEEMQKQSMPVPDPKNFKQWLADNNMNKTGEETLSGFGCSIYQGRLRIDDSQPPVPMTIWYSEKLAHPLKQEVVMPAPMGKMVTYLENIALAEQPDRLFEVPEGYTKTGSLQEAMGMGTASMPTPGGNAGGRPPSEEEMGQMMEKMQEMLKNMGKE
jgi:hypothetical protein